LSAIVFPPFLKLCFKLWVIECTVSVDGVPDHPCKSAGRRLQVRFDPGVGCTDGQFLLGRHGVTSLRYDAWLRNNVFKKNCTHFVITQMKYRNNLFDLSPVKFYFSAHLPVKRRSDETSILAEFSNAHSAFGDFPPDLVRIHLSTLLCVYLLRSYATS
jgi:hypothetical protein